MTKEIKRCPFCGGKASVCHPGFTGALSVVKCENCKAVTGYVEKSTSYCSDDKAIELWNARAEAELSDKHWEECRQIALYDDELRQTVGALRRAIKLLSNAGVHNDDYADIERLSNEMWDKIYKKHETTNNLESKR